jgi:hypothetical protein
LYGLEIAIKQGETQLFPAVTASKLLGHTDSFVEGNKKDATQSVAEPDKKDTEEESTQELRDSIRFMNVKALVNYAKVNYRMDLDEKKSAQDLRNEVTRLIDQYGAQ